MGAGWSLIGTNSGFYVSGRYLHEAWWLWLFACGNVYNARRCKRICYNYYCAFCHRNFIRRFCYHDAEGSEIHQCLFIRQSLWICLAGHWHAHQNIYDRCSNANGFAWFDDGSFLCCYRHDIRTYTYQAGE